MGKARTPGAPWYLRPLALLIAGVLLCVVGVCYGRARLAGRQAEAQRAGQVARRGCPLALGQDLVRHALFRYQTRASLLVYRLPATRHQKQIILRRLGKINQEGSAYNLLGLLFPVAWQPNQMFCSQFVYRMLRLAGLHYFRKDPFQVRPMDFVDLDAQGALTLVAAYTRVGGRLLAREARPLPAGWQASA